MTQVLSDIEFVRILGRGEFGEVWHARMAPHRDVAVKKIHRKSAKNLDPDDWDQIRKHLMKEAENLKKAQHKHVVSVFSVHWDEEEDHVFIVMELCEFSLDSLIKNGPLPPAKTFICLSQLLLGLEALHNQGMLHRDIKPSNILIKGNDVLLSDFGLVTDELINGYGNWESYAPHRAPEIWTTGVTSTKTDIWAVGITAFRLLNGERWYAEEMNARGVDWYSPNVSETLRKIVCSPNFGSSLPWLPHIPVAWRKVVNRALATDSAKRYSTAGAMLNAFQGMKLASLPEWSCVHTSNAITWTRPRKNGRQERVELQNTQKPFQNYHIYTQGSDGAKRYKIREGAGSRSQVLSELEDFFSDRSV